MSLFVSWIVFPLLLTVLALGCGLLLEEVAGIRLPGVLVVPAGLAVIFVITHFATATDATAELAAPAVLAACIAGMALSPPWRRGGGIDRWAVGLGVCTLAVFSLPVVLSGDATFTGYIKLDDTATWLAITDQLMEHGREVKGLAPSSYEATVQINLGGGYPWGAFPALGLGHELLGTDSAWLFQPYLALLGSMLGICLYIVSAPLVNSRPLRALAAFIASQAALLFGYYLWGGIKEMAAAWLLALMAALVTPLLRNASARDLLSSVRALIPLAIAASALIGVLSFGGVAWIGPVLLAAAVLLYFQLGTERTLLLVGGFLVVGFVVALPSVLTATTFLSPSSGTLTSATDLGNLFEPLKFVQVFGIWPNPDFRHEPDSLDVTYVLIFVVIAMAGVGVWYAWQRKSWSFLIYVGAALIGGFAIFQFASPWVGAKGLATASPAFLFAALVAAFAMFERGRRTEGALAAVAIIAGVAWSNVLAYQGVTIAPRDRLHELEQIADKIQGEGPTLMTDYEPYGVRHFLRKADPEGASELRRRQIPLRSGQELGKIGYADIDEFQLDAVLTYRTLVLRRSPVSSRPPGPYNLVSTGTYYEVWQRPDPLSARLIDHLPLGQNPDPTSVPGCAAIESLARAAGPDGMVAAAHGTSPIVLPLPTTSHPPDWTPGDGGQITPTGPGTLQTSVKIPKQGVWGIWLAGSFRDELELLVDGRRVSDLRHELTHSGPYTPLASVPLTQGEHSLALRYEDKDLHPGSGGDPFQFGPLALNLVDSSRPGPTVRRPDGSKTAASPAGHLVPIKSRPITYMRPAEARSLCGRRLDWVEAIAR
jgi:hypothetical protein